MQDPQNQKNLGLLLAKHKLDFSLHCSWLTKMDFSFTTHIIYDYHPSNQQWLTVGFLERLKGSILLLSAVLFASSEKSSIQISMTLSGSSRQHQTSNQYEQSCVCWIRHDVLSYQFLFCSVCTHHVRICPVYLLTNDMALSCDPPIHHSHHWVHCAMLM